MPLAGEPNQQRVHPGEMIANKQRSSSARYAVMADHAHAINQPERQAQQPGHQFGDKTPLVWRGGSFGSHAFWLEFMPQHSRDKPKLEPQHCVSFSPPA